MDASPHLLPRKLDSLPLSFKELSPAIAHNKTDADEVPHRSESASWEVTLYNRELAMVSRLTEGEGQVQSWASCASSELGEGL